MNSLVKINENSYRLTTENGSVFTCGTWYEKKTDAWHVRLPKEATDLCGRTYIRVSIAGDHYEFETKTTHREGLGNGGWKSRMTEAEKAEYAELEARMEAIKQAAMAREITEEEKLEREIAKLLAKKAELQKARQA